VLDGIVLEKAGIPAVSIVTEPFIGTGQAMAASHGVPNYRFVAMPHPIANLTEAELNTRADVLTDQVVALIQSPQGSE
jgi:hypothetical protein